MTNEELNRLFETSQKRIDEIERTYRITGSLSRKDANDLRHATQRLGLIARESWIAAGKPDGPEFDCLREPIKLSPLPASMRPLDLSDRLTGGNH
jgi:hypothetical protein